MKLVDFCRAAHNPELAAPCFPLGPGAHSLPIGDAPEDVRFKRAEVLAYNRVILFWFEPAHPAGDLRRFYAAVATD